MSISIPRILHQLWIGDASKAPTKFMATWREMCTNNGFEYVFWNEARITEEIRNNPRFSASLASLQHRIDEMEEINGKADIIRWVILLVYGGVFCDADSVCIESIDKHLLEVKEGAFSCFENEHVRGPGWSPHYREIHSHQHALIALGCVGFPPQHPLVKAANKWIQENPVSVRVVGQRAWYSVGPGLITRLYYDDHERYKGIIKIFPSHYFLPMHYNGVHYGGHERVYAYQEWGSTKQSYATMNQIEVPSSMRDPPPHEAHTVLMPSYNTKAIHLRECLDSIRRQVGHFWIDLVCVDDGSDALHKSILRRMLDELEGRSRWIRVHRHENESNMGICATLSKGLAMCPKENTLVFRMDTDDIMHSDRMGRQIAFFRENPSAVLCGTQVNIFDDRTGRVVQTTSHPPTVEWDAYRHSNSPAHWIANHPTYCFRLDSILEIGGYNTGIHSVCEDFDLLLRVMRRYGRIHNLPEALVHYRLHEAQITKQLRGGSGNGSRDWVQIRNDMVRHYSDGAADEMFRVSE